MAEQIFRVRVTGAEKIRFHRICAALGERSEDIMASGVRDFIKNYEDQLKSEPKPGDQLAFNFGG